MTIERHEYDANVQSSSGENMLQRKAVIFNWAIWFTSPAWLQQHWLLAILHTDNVRRF